MKNLQPRELSGAELDEAVEHLKKLIRIDSRNPGPFEENIAVHLVDILKAEGFTCTVVEPHQRRKNVFTSIEGSDRSKSILLTAHMDTVPFDEKRWTVPPLSAEERNGSIYGRGALDMKHHLAYCLMTMLLLKRKGIKSLYTVKFSAFADEETGCGFGSHFIAERHPELIKADYSLNEAGGFPIYFKKRKIFLIGSEEKGFAWIMIKLRGIPGHGSIPTKDNIILKINTIVEQIRKKDHQVFLSRSTRGFIEGLRGGEGAVGRFVLGLLRYPILTDRIIESVIPLGKRSAFYAMFHNTYNPTVVTTDESINVVPSELNLCLDCRIAPGSSVERILATVRSVIGKGGEVELIKGSEPVVVNESNPLYSFIEKKLQAESDDIETIPFLTVGFTDNANLARLGIKTIGFTPIDLPPDINYAELCHSHDERIPTMGFRWGADFFYRIVRDFITEPGGDTPC